MCNISSTWLHSTEWLFSLLHKEVYYICRRCNFLECSWCIVVYWESCSLLSIVFPWMWPIIRAPFGSNSLLLLRSFLIPQFLLPQMTAHRAFQFCLQYKRTTEFRRLCEILRNHLTNLNKYRDQRDRPDLTQPESLQLYLETRFEQLKIATELELWQVGIEIFTRTWSIIFLNFNALLAKIKLVNIYLGFLFLVKIIFLWRRTSLEFVPWLFS